MPRRKPFPQDLFDVLPPGAVVLSCDEMEAPFGDAVVVCKTATGDGWAFRRYHRSPSHNDVWTVWQEEGISLTAAETEKFVEVVTAAKSA